jgi:hypothetical protein
MRRPVLDLLGRQAPFAAPLHQYFERAVNSLFSRVIRYLDKNQDLDLLPHLGQRRSPFLREGNPMTDNRSLHDMTRAVITVNVGGRGFIVKGGSDRLVITVAHCLPLLPPAVSFSFSEEKTYQDLLAPLGEQPSIWAECPVRRPSCRHRDPRSTRPPRSHRPARSVRGAGRRGRSVRDVRPGPKVPRVPAVARNAMVRVQHTTRESGALWVMSQCTRSSRRSFAI